MENLYPLKYKNYSFFITIFIENLILLRLKLIRFIIDCCIIRLSKSIISIEKFNIIYMNEEKDNKLFGRRDICKTTIS